MTARGRDADVNASLHAHPAGHPLGAGLFDMDGLLVDTEPLWSVAEAELAARHGAVWDAEIKARCIGTALPDAVPMMLDYFGVVHPSDDELDGAQKFLLGRMVELFATELPLQPGALELVDALRSAGVPTALVSSSYRVLVDAVLAVVGPHRFEFTLAGDEVSRTKPDPEPYLTAAEALGVPPARCVVFEDAPSGIAAAEAAGCLAIGIPGHAPLEATPDRPVFASLADIDVDWLLGLPRTLRRAS
jgi:HAD superfamily hydrolase (TIGR01509 family)